MNREAESESGGEELAAPRVRRRHGGRAGNTRAKRAAIEQLAWSNPVNLDKPTEPLPPEGVEAIHDTGMKILEEIGVEFINPEAVDILKKQGCIIEETTEGGAVVRMGREFVMEKIKLAPAEFEVTPRNPKRKIKIGGKSVTFGHTAGSPNYSNLDEGRNVGTRKAYQDFLKLTQYFNCMHFLAGYAVEPVDIHPSTRHLDAVFDKLTLTDKVVHIYSLGKERVEDSIELIRIASGLSHEEFDSEPRMFTNINSTSPLKHDRPMLDGMMRLTRRGQPTIVTPFTLSGAMSPITLAGTVAQSVAEALCAIALIQTIKPGCPCVFGTFSSNVDMRSGAPAFGTPEYMRTTQMTGQMTRFYGLPMRASNVCVSNAPDNQSTWESANSLFACMTSGTHMVYHGAGWLEGGLCASYEKFVMDCEHIQQMISYMKPVEWNEEECALEAIREVGQGGHYFGVPHTQERFETAYYSPFLSDWSNFGAWEEKGSIQAVQRANRVWKDILAEFKPPSTDSAIREELEAFVAKRKEEGGAPTDF